MRDKVAREECLEEGLIHNAKEGPLTREVTERMFMFSLIQIRNNDNSYDNIC